jgi:hypothetical protein
MPGQLGHASVSRRPDNDPILKIDAGEIIAGPQHLPRDDDLGAPNDRPTVTDGVHVFPNLQPLPGDDVFSTSGGRPAVAGTYSLKMPRRTTAGSNSILDQPTKDTLSPGRLDILRAPSMISTRQTNRQIHPRSPRFEHLLETRASRRRLIAEAGCSQVALVNHARGQARLRRQLEHHKECIRDLEACMWEGEELRLAGVLHQTEESDDLRRLVQDGVDLETRYTGDRVEKTRNAAHVSVRRQLARKFHIERKAVATFDRARKIARLKGGLRQPGLPSQSRRSLQHPKDAGDGHRLALLREAIF